MPYTMRLERPGYIVAAAVGAFYAAKEGAFPSFPDGDTTKTLLFTAGIGAGELDRRLRESDDVGSKAGWTKFAVVTTGLAGMRYGIAPDISNFMAGIGVTSGAFVASEFAVDIYDRHQEKSAERKKRRANKKKNKEND